MSKKYKNKGRLPAGGWVWIGKAMMGTTAWRMLTPGAKCTYLVLKGKLSNDASNNGRVFLSLREAADEVGSNKDSIGRWLRELQHYGFIVLTRAGTLGTEGRGMAPHFRLTEFPYQSQPETRDYLYFNGEKFRDRRPTKTKSRPHYWGQGVPTLRDGRGGLAARFPAPTVPTTGDIGTSEPVPTTGVHI